MKTSYSLSYPADQHYFSKALENAVQVAIKPLSLIGLYITNSSGNTIWVLVSDDAAGPHGIATNDGTIYPVAAEPGDLAISLHGGQEFRKGLFIGAYLTKADAIAGGAPNAGNVLLIKADYTGPKYTPV